MKNNSEIKVFTGQEALLLCSDIRFQASWDALYKACSWATIFQSRPFVTTWYNIYQQEYLPVIIKAERNGVLLGLLTVAKDKKNLITGAGANQAEYQVWLATDINGNSFIVDALLALDKYFPGSKVNLAYIDNRAPLSWTTESAFGRRRCFLKATKHYYVSLNQAYIVNKLKKPSRKSKINRLKRLGELKFERIADPATFTSLIDQLSVLSDFRKGAMFNKFYFRDDPLLVKFLMAILELNILHASVLMLNDEIIASNIGIMGNAGKVMHSGNNAHVPSYAKYSPGILHFLFLSKHLSDEGVEVLDLGPGDNFYKEEIGSDYTVGYTLCVSDVFHTVSTKVKDRIIRQAKTVATSVGVKPASLRRIKTDADIHGIPSIIKSFLNKTWRNKATRRLKIERNNIQTSGSLIRIQKDSLYDLLAYDQGPDAGLPRWRFLSEAKDRLEAGEHCYTWMEDNKLLACVWLKELTTAENGDGNSIDPACSGVLLDGLYCHSLVVKNINEFLMCVAAGCGRDKVYAEVKEPGHYQTLIAAGFAPLTKE